jgi:hypothetical protein
MDAMTSKKKMNEDEQGRLPLLASYAVAAVPVPET